MKIRPVNFRDLVEGEHMHRHCQGCHYEWFEKPLDKKVDTDG